MERNSSNYSLIEPQLLHCTPSCGNKFHTRAVHPHSHTDSTFSRRDVLSLVEHLRWSVFARIVNVLKSLGIFPGVLRRWMFDRILNATLSSSLWYLEEGLRRSFSQLGLQKGILDSPASYFCSFTRNTKTTRSNLGLTPRLHFLE